MPLEHDDPEVHVNDYDHVRCPTCGVPWPEHTDLCPRHQCRYLYECRGHGRGGVYRCCARAGEHNGFGSDGPLAFTCPNDCSCHD